MASRLQDVIQRGTAASRPAATTVAPGTLYFSTDTTVIERSDGSVWQPYSAIVATSGGADFTNAGHPQGVVTAVGGQTCRDTVTGRLYIHLPLASSNTGWYLLRPESAGAAAAGPTTFLVWANNYDGAPTGGGISVYNTSNLAADSLKLATGHYCEATTNSSSGTNGGWNTSFQSYYAAGDFDLVMAVRTGSTLTDARLWAGLNSTTLPNSDDVSGDAAIFRYSAGVDTSWVGYSRDGTTASVTSAIGSIATNTEYRLRIRLVTAGTPTLYFSVNDGAEVAKTTNLPRGTVAAGLFFWVFNKNATGQHFWYRQYALQFGS